MMKLNFYDLNSLDYDLEPLEKELKKLPPLHRLAFAASMGERAMPTYNAFVREEGWGNPTVLREALDEVWEIVLGKPVNKEKIEQLMRNIDTVTPHVDYFSGAKYCFDAVESVDVIYTILNILNYYPSLEEPVFAAVAKSLREAIAGFIIIEKDIEGSPSWLEKMIQEKNQEIASHPFAVREIAKESDDLQRLKEVETLDPDFVEWLRFSFDNDGKSVLDLS